MGKAQLHEVLAVLPALKGTAAKIAAETKKTFVGKAGHFNGMIKVYKPMDEDGETLPSEESPLVTTVGEKLMHFARTFGPSIDGALQVDKTNLKALADVRVDGIEFKDVPATFLMQLDKRLAEIRTVYDVIPTLDPKHTWLESDQGAGVFKANATIVNRTAKVLQSKILVQPTTEHPAQVEKWMADTKIGEYETKRTSGAITPRKKYEILARIDELQKAVKKALASANRVEHDTDKIADQIFNFIHGDLPMSRGENK